MKGKRLGLLHFLDVCQQTIVREWSMWRSPTLHLVDEITHESIKENKNQLKFSSTPTITDADMVSAYKWNSFNQTIRHLNSKYYYVMNTKKNGITKEECKAFEKALTEKNWTSFDAMIKCIFSINRIEVDLNWRESSCTCWFGLKD
ncbi:hypothetical protein BpHYR1_035293 [Brachionus plicatilis]|uniref:Uncharacterized protein n=1 Tax=Brachionus plicatilis TaxID=10195 RepID=A0A3M7RUE3_BRAPC|nr:hypothetical protein BpHYR1_035293 [Brachionus plicatilis]